MAHISSFTAHLSTSYDFVSLAADTVADSLAWLLDETSAWKTSAVRERLVRLHGLAAKVSGQRSVESKCSRGSECNLRFAAQSWLFWDALAELQADERIKVEDGPKAVHELALQICTGHRFLVDCDPSDEQREANLLRRALASLYRLYNALSGRSTLISAQKQVHKQHREYNLSALVIPTLRDEVFGRATLYGYM